MKIGIDCRIYSTKFTGIGRYTYELTRRIPHLDNKNHYVLFFNNPQYHEYIPPAYNIKKVLVNAGHYSFAEQIKFLRILLREKLDLMHFTHFNAPIFYYRPFIVTIHDLIISFFPGKKYSPLKRLAYHIVINNVAKHAKKIIAVSENTKRDIVKHLHINPKKIEIIYEGIGDEFHKITQADVIKKTLKKYGISKPFLLYTGVHRGHKNLMGLIKAFKILTDKYGPKYQLVITGKHDPYYPEIYVAANDSSVKQNIIFTDIVPEEDLIILYSAAELYVHPSFYEGFGFCPLEAMACGTPVAVSRTSSLPEVCGEENAIFFDPHDITDMAHQIHKGLVNENLRKRLTKNGLERVKNFNWNNVAAKTLELYNKTLNKI